METNAYSDEGEIRAIVQRFEGCDFRIEEFTHARHLTVAAWYLMEFPPDDARVRMRTGLLRFLEHHGKQGYHETITRFWMELIGSFLRPMPDGVSPVNKVNRVLKQYGRKGVLFEYYTRELVMSDVAKGEWVEPDLKVIEPADRTRVL